MNRFVTHSDKNYLKYAERLFESLQNNTNTVIIYYTVDFHYKSKYKNVIPVYFSTKDYISSSSYKKLDVKSCLVFLKSIIAELSLKNYAKSVNDSFCYIDCDCLAKKELDSIFNHAQNITNYPLLNRACFEYMLLNGRGDPFMYGYFNLNNCLEAELLKALNIDLNLRTSTYAQTGVFVFNSKCSDFITEWKNTCFLDFIFNDQVKYAPFHEETVINCLLWKNKYSNNLSQVLINIPYESNETSSLANIRRMNQALDNVSDNGYLLSVFCYIPSKKDINNLYFYHGKISDSEYNLFKEMNHRLLLKIHSPSLGDTIACTPTLRKLYHAYGKKLTVATHHKDIFKNNKYIEECIDFSELKNKTTAFEEVFETFLYDGRKNNFGVEKKHNTIDIRQFHAIDLGFMLAEGEMEYDFIADPYQQIDNLPNQYVCLHVCATWPSRTYALDNWQKIIDDLNNNGISVVLVGKDSSEQGFYNINKQVQKLRVAKGIDLTNKLSLSQAWHVINKSSYFITMDSGLLHLAGTTDAFIIQLGSSINNKLRAPFRYNSQDYKYKYVSGPCDIFCASNMKYGVREWGTIQGIPRLIDCLENKTSFECHPNVDQVLTFLNIKKEKCKINIVTIDKEASKVIYSCDTNKIENFKIKIIDPSTGFIIYQEDLSLEGGCEYWTDFSYYKNFITEKIKIIFEQDSHIILEQVCFFNWVLNNFFPVSFGFQEDVEFYSYYEVFHKNLYNKYNIDVEKNDIVVDIGSNQGSFIKYSLDKGCSEIYSCEPNPSCLAIINKYFSNHKNLIVNPFAISKDSGESFLQVGKGGDLSACAKIIEAKGDQSDSYYENSKNIKIKTISFDQFIKLNKLTVIDFLKIDCEGAEEFIFTPENEIYIKKNVKKIALEYHNDKRDEILQFLTKINFHVNMDKFGDLVGMIYAINKNHFEIKTEKLIHAHPKYLFITGHLSTGGAPKYLEWLIKEKAKEGAQIKVIEWNLYSEEYNIQRNEIIKFVGEENFINIGHYDEPSEIFKEKENKAITLINNYQPDFIHLNDFSEQFALQGMSEKFVLFLYDTKRNYKICETLHDSVFDVKNKKNIPDEFWFCSDFHEEVAKKLKYNYKIVEMQIEKKIRPDRNQTLSSLGLNPDFYHVLQVGLICANKNQKFTADLAKQFLDKPVQFHFVGNLCFLNECGIDVNQKNCKFWGERSDVDKFLSCMDLFVMPSFRELNPISVKEALAWDMKCFVSNLEIFHKKYSGNDNISIISGTNLQEHISNSLNKNKKRFITNFSLDTNDILVSYNPSPRVDIIGDQVCNYDVKFIDQKDGSVKHQSRITNNMWTSCFIRYYVDWKILITNLIDDSEIVFFMDLKGKTVKISNESSSLGDIIAWMPIVDQFQKKHNCKVDFYTAKRDLLQKQYLNINFYDYSTKNNNNYYCEYKIGCFSQENRTLDKTHWANLSLQDVACSILDVEKPQARTKLKTNSSFSFLNHKYVCIATQSTSQSRYWNNKGGWKRTVDYLHSLGYKVICVDKERHFGVQDFMNFCPENVDYFVGSESFDNIINIINKAEFFIGLSSGLSWVSWALNKKTVIISGSVSEKFEFHTPYRVTNTNVCNGCFDNTKYSFDPSDWKWCPANKDFECSKEITFDMVKQKINLIINND